MKKVHLFLLFCVIAIVVASCSTGNMAYKRGDYYQACLESIDRLRANPKNKTSQNVLIQAYPLAQTTALREIDNALLANGTNKYEVQVYQYERLNQLADNIFHCPKALELIPQPTQYIVELSKARQMAADQVYEMGIKAMDVGTIDQARVAYHFFQNADKFVKGYKDVVNKLVEAHYAATLRVIVRKPSLNQNFQYSADFFYNSLLIDLRHDAQNRFVRYYTTEEAYREKMHNPHQFIVLNFEDFSISTIKESSHSIELKRDSVKVGEVKVEGKTYNSYNTVKAKLVTFRRDISSGGMLRVRIIDALNNRELQHNDFTGNYNWDTRWSIYKGDDRALTDKQKEMCKKEPKTPPSDQDFFIEFTKPLYPQAVSAIQSFNNRY